MDTECVIVIGKRQISLSQMLCFLKNRAQAAMEFLQELNNDVSGSFVEEVYMYICYYFCTEI